MNKRNKNGFTLAEVITAVGILVIVVLFASIIFRDSIEAYRLAGANAEIIQKLQTITTELDRDFGQVRTNGYLCIYSDKVNQQEFSNNKTKFADVNTGGIYYFTTGDFQSAVTGQDKYGKDVYERSNIAVVYLGHDSQSLNSGMPCVSKYRLAKTVTLLTPIPKSVKKIQDCNIISYSQIRNALQVKDYNFIKNPYYVMAHPVDLNKQDINGNFINYGSFMTDGVGNLKIEWNYGDKDYYGRLFWHREIVGWQNWWQGQQWPKALKFTFTLYDSKEVLKEGRIFSHIVYMNEQ